MPPLLAQAAPGFRAILLFVLIALVVIGLVVAIDHYFPIAPGARWVVGLILVIGLLLGAGAWFGLF